MGGSVAQYLGAKYGIKTETFAAYGVGNILSREGVKSLPIHQKLRITFALRSGPQIAGESDGRFNA